MEWSAKKLSKHSAQFPLGQSERDSSKGSSLKKKYKPQIIVDHLIWRKKRSSDESK